MIGCIMQARTGSKRFPRKIYEDLSGKSTLYRVLESVTSSKVLHKIILAMPEYDEHEFNTKFQAGEFKGAVDDRFCTYFGDPDNLVDRYFNAARKYGISTVVRVTCDCPFGGVMIDEMIIEYMKCGGGVFMGNNELVSGVPYPDGVDVEIFPYWMLAETSQLTTDPVNLEHVTPFMYKRGTEYKIVPFLNRRPNSMLSMKFPDFSFDTEEDRQLLLKMTHEYDKERNIYPNSREVDLLNAAIKRVSFPKREWKKI
jgi:spore coat polysaccharide biosynthesis protein SpsF (cytidylyltransferase family)